VPSLHPKKIVTEPLKPVAAKDFAHSRTDRISIVHVTPVYKPLIGGIGTIVHNLAQVTTRHGDANVNVLFCDSEWWSRDKTILRDGDVNVFHIKTVKIWFAFFPIGLSKHVARADIIHIHDPFFSPLTIATLFFAKPSAKIIMTTHGGFFHTKRWLPLKLLYFHTFCRLAALRFSAIAAVSRQDLGRFSKISNRVILIENGAEIEKFDTSCPIPKENKFLFVGRLSRNKNVGALVDVFLKLQRVRQDVTLDLVGEDPYNIWQTTIAPKILSYPDAQITYRGKLDDRSVVNLMQSTRFFILASSYEGFGIAVVEAMAAGRIPIVSDIQPMRDLITNGQNGFIIDFNDTESAAATVDEILNYPPVQLTQIADAARLSSRKFSWNSVGKAYLTLYDKCLRGAV
jgi:alpha-1,3-mannosyltransferase